MTAAPEEKWVDVSSMPAAQWKRVDAECSYEARKATAAAPPGPVRLLDREELYFACVKLRGAIMKRVS
jgi:hypothetical protein